jgi:uncharacterized sulfatase
MTNRRACLASASGLTATLRQAWAAPRSGAQGERPNVLFLAADDMNNALGCYGHPVVKTPNIDALAARGVRFDRAYCQYPLCGPSRASLLTGLRPDRTRVLGNNIDFRDHLPGAVTLPQLFKNHGYFTAREGKMFHMNVPGEVGTPRFQDAVSWNHSVSPQGLENRTPGERRVTSPGRPNAMNWIAAESETGQADTNAADHAIALLEQHRRDPFFLGVGLLRPHLPFVAPAKYFDLYPLPSLSPARNPPDDLDDIPTLAKSVRPYTWNQMGMGEQEIRESLRGYYASTSYMDAQVGRVLQALDRLQLRDRTIVVFWGDHGWNLGEHTRWQKMSLMEDSSRVPLIVAAPGRKGNGQGCRALVEFVDVYPTLAGLCGLPAPPGLDGRSFRALLDSPRRPFKDAAYTQLLFEDITGRAVRTDRYRYIRWERQGTVQEELYDHQSDPGEFTNLASRGGQELARHRQRIAGRR